jgi:hypothetical protein
MDMTMDAATLKQLLKEALAELLVENREDFLELLAEAIEDAAMVKAIQEGEDSPLVNMAGCRRRE